MRQKFTSHLINGEGVVGRVAPRAPSGILAQPGGRGATRPTIYEMVCSNLVAGVSAFLLALTLSACGPAQSASEKQAPSDIRGEPINATRETVSPVKDKAMATTPQPIAAPTAPAPAIATTTKVPEEKPAPAAGGYISVGFDKLASYNFDVPDDVPVTNTAAGPDKADEQIPATVKAFNRKKVTIKGFMLPLKVEGGVVTEYLILKDQSMCCYGNVPKITEWVSVKSSGKGVKPIMDQPVSIEGTLHVGAMRENGYLVGIYQLDGEKMVETGDN